MFPLIQGKFLQRMQPSQIALHCLRVLQLTAEVAPQPEPQGEAANIAGVTGEKQYWNVRSTPVLLLDAGFQSSNGSGSRYQNAS